MPSVAETENNRQMEMLRCLRINQSKVHSRAKRNVAMNADIDVFAEPGGAGFEG